MGAMSNEGIVTLLGVSARQRSCELEVQLYEARFHEGRLRRPTPARAVDTAGAGGLGSRRFRSPRAIEPLVGRRYYAHSSGIHSALPLLRLLTFVAIVLGSGPLHHSRREMLD
jgi:hypothetical protein